MEQIIVGLFVSCFIIAVISVFTYSYYSNKILENYGKKNDMNVFGFGRKNYKNTLVLVDQFKRKVLENVVNKNDFEYFILFRKISQICQFTAFVLFVILIFIN